MKLRVLILSLCALPLAAQTAKPLTDAQNLKLANLELRFMKDQAKVAGFQRAQEAFQRAQQDAVGAPEDGAKAQQEFQALQKEYCATGTLNNDKSKENPDGRYVCLATVTPAAPAPAPAPTAPAKK